MVLSLLFGSLGFPKGSFLSHLFFNSLHSPAPLLLYMPSFWAVVHYSAPHFGASWTICNVVGIILAYLRSHDLLRSLIKVQRRPASLLPVLGPPHYLTCFRSRETSLIWPAEKHFLHLRLAFLFCFVYKWKGNYYSSEEFVWWSYLSGKQ